MKAAYFHGVGDIRVEETLPPEAGADELVIKMKASAICGTDLRILKFGHFKIPGGTKRVLGHEIAGEVVQVGKNVTQFKIGMRVALPPNVGCGACAMCRRGYTQLCPTYEAFGISYDGGFQDYVKVPARAIARGNVVVIPDGISYEEAAMVEPFSCAYHSYKALNIKPGDSVVVIGAGPIGGCHVLMSKLAGAAKIIVADVQDNRLEEMVKLGVDVTVNSAKEDLKQAVLRETDGEGASVIITACSIPQIQTLAMELAATHGRINLFGGMPKDKEIVPLNTNLIHYKELTVLGTTGSSVNDYCESMALVASGKLNLMPLASARFGVSQINAAFDYALSGQGMKTLVVEE
ncbi:alcohol dehydrogenase catalytic domain-containing protein [Enterobacteriaceae bacterium 4M9]|nr:alcohol dehydrogenase catalytic domain-containing protein [Enterobacteriaceae bacterium 4M9]